MSADRARALAAVTIDAPDDDFPPALCSGVVLGPSALLTARHCLDFDNDGVWDQVQPDALRPTLLTIAATDDAPARTVQADNAALHPTLDVALLTADFGDADVPNLEPMLEALGEDWVGAPVELSGYGVEESSTAGVLTFATETVARMEDDYIVVDGEGRSGACRGDSGGALLGRDDDGVVRVLGVLDHGDRSCTGQDYYTRLDALTAWEPFARALQGARGGLPCDGLDTTGACFRGRAMWCDAGSARAEACGPDSVCGWSGSASGFRCIPPADDACQGNGSFRTCIGEAVRSCEAGSLRSVPCGNCGVCTPWVDGRGAGCAMPLDAAAE